jgi:hypothetical protein
MTDFSGAAFLAAAAADNPTRKETHTMTSTFRTRNLTSDESERFTRSLLVALGKATLADTALRAIADQGLGLFVAEPNTFDPGDQVTTHSGRTGEIVDVGQSGELAFVRFDNSIEALPVAALRAVDADFASVVADTYNANRDL